MEKNLITFSKDGRAPIEFLFQSFSKLKNAGWQMLEVFKQEENQGAAKFSLPILCFVSPNKGSALWILSGIHGEESAPSNSLARNINVLIDLAKTIPIVIFPLLNPLGYIRDWRYPDEYRDCHKGHSVSSAEHLLLDYQNTKVIQPRMLYPESKEAGTVTSKIIELMRDYPPLISIDHHEDEFARFAYVYSYSQKSNCDAMAREIIKILESENFYIQKYGRTRFGENIKNGIVVCSSDGSVDELLSAKQIVVNSKLIIGPSALFSLVVETPITNVTLNRRIKAHAAIIKSYKNLFLTAKQIFVNSKTSIFEN